MNILSDVSTSELGEAHFAHIILSKSLAQDLLELREKCRPLFSLEGFYGVEFFDYSPTIHTKEGGYKDEDLSGNWMEIEDEDWEPADGSELRVDCGVMTIKPDGVIWRMSIKHSDESAETQTIDWATIEKAAKE